MPELPEVETVRRTLEPYVLNRPICRVEVLYPRALQDTSPKEFSKALEGSSFVELRRRGKYLLFEVSTGLYMVVHLRMTGRLIVVSSNQVPIEKHTAAIFQFGEGSELRFVDQRKFGTINLLPPERLMDIRGLREMGPEPLGDEFTPRYLARILKGRKAPIKSVLLDQRRIAGLGNIYADEALFAADSSRTSWRRPYLKGNRGALPCGSQRPNRCGGQSRDNLPGLSHGDGQRGLLSE